MNSALCGGTANGSADFIPLGAPFTATVVFDANSVGLRAVGTDQACGAGLGQRLGELKCLSRDPARSRRNKFRAPPAVAIGARTSVRPADSDAQLCCGGINSALRSCS